MSGSRTVHEAGDGRVLRRLRRRRGAIVRAQAALAAAWLAQLGRQRFATRTYRAPATFEGMGRAIRVWLLYLENEARTDAPDAATVRAFRCWALRTRQPGSVIHLLEAVRACYRWAAATGRQRDIARSVAYPPTPAGPPPPALAAGDYQRAVAAIAGEDLRAHRDRALMWLLWSCPVDTIALHRAQVGSVDLDRGLITLSDRWRVSQARRRGRPPTTTYPLLPRALIAIAAYLHARGTPDPAEPLLRSLRGQRPLSLLSMRLAVLRALSAAGLRGSGLDRRQALARYPRIAPADLAGLDARLPADPALADQLRALAHLLAIPDLHIAWERLPAAAVDLAAGRIRCRGRGRGGPTVDIALPAAARPVLARWLGHRPSGALFPGSRDDQADAAHLRGLAWSLFPERLPPGPRPRGPRGSSSLLRRAAIARGLPD